MINDLKKEIENSIGNKKLKYDFFEINRQDYQDLILKNRDSNFDSLKNQNEYTIEIIDYNRIIRGGTRSSVKKKIKKKIVAIQDGDHACHIIGRCLGGTNRLDNLFAGTSTLNSSIMNHVEKITKQYIIDNSGDKILYKVLLESEKETRRVKTVSIIIVPFDIKIKPVGICIKNV